MDIYTYIEKVEIALETGNEELIDKAFREMMSAEEERSHGEYHTYEDFVIAIREFVLFARNHARKCDMNSLAGFFINDWAPFVTDVLKNATLTEEESLNIKKEFLKLETFVRGYLSKEANGPDAEKEKIEQANRFSVRKEGQRCLLCKKAIADEVGSHMVPNCLIEKLFSFDGNKGRDREAVERFTLGKGEHIIYLGRDIAPQAKPDLINHAELPQEKDEEVQLHNPLTFDHFFCKECEKRLSTLESWYSAIQANPNKQYPPAIPYLFWMSVIWRMSISKMGMFLPNEHEEKYRKILDKSLNRDKDKILVDVMKLGHCAYTIQKAVETKGEALGILGFSEPTIPAVCLIGDREIRFYHSLDKARKMLKKSGMSVDKLNDGSKPEVIPTMKFIDFWKTKRSILDITWERDYDYNLFQEDSSEVSQFIFLQNPEVNALEATGNFHHFEYDAINTGSEKAVTLPAAVFRVKSYLEAHPNCTKEEVFQATGYTEEEVTIFMEYFLSQLDWKIKEFE